MLRVNTSYIDQHIGKIKALVMGMAAAALFFSMACSASESEAPSAPAPAAPAVASQAQAYQPASPAQPAAAAPAAAAAAAENPAIAAIAKTSPVTKQFVAGSGVSRPDSKYGTLVWATKRMGEGALGFSPFLGAVSDHYGVKEPLFWHRYGPVPERPGVSDELSIANGWELSSDSATLTVDIRPDVDFHHGWGKVTAEDVAWSFNDSLREGNLNPRSGFWGAYIGKVSVVDSDTVQFHAPEGKTISPRWSVELSNTWRGTQSIHSKKAFDELGEEGSRDEFTGTGPFKTLEWTTDEGFVGEALPTHYRETANVERFKVVVIPETAALVAAFMTGEIHTSVIPNAHIKEAVKVADGSMLRLGEPRAGFFFFGGNFWQKTHAGETIFPREGLKADDDHPWIGDPDDPARMESARKVRLAMAMSIDAQLLSDEVEAGLNPPSLTYTGMDKGHRLFKPEYDIPYDPQMGKALLKEAGYPTFDVKFWINPTDPIYESALAATEMIRAGLGLNVELETTGYSARRPSLIGRTISVPFLHARSIGDDTEPKGRLLSAEKGGANRGMEIPNEILDQTWYAGLASSSVAETEAANIILQDFLSKWTLQAPLTARVSYAAVSPEVIQWRPYMDTFGSQSSPESVILKR